MTRRMRAAVVAVLGCTVAAAAQAQPAGLDRRALRGWEELLAGDLTRAEQTFRRQIEREKPSGHDYGGLALTEFMRDDFQSAQLHFSVAASLAPAAAEGPLYLELAEQTSRYVNDLSAFREVCGRLARLADDPMGTGRLARYLLVSSLLAAGDAETARTYAADDGFLRSWALALPFANDEELGFETAYEPERGVALAATYSGRHGRHIRWVALPHPPLDGIVPLGELADPSSQAVAYAVTYIRSTQTAAVTFAIGHAGAAKVWVNGLPAYTNPDYHGVVPDQWVFGTQLEAGWNELLVKVCSKRGPWGFSLRQLRVPADPGPLETTVDPVLVAEGPAAPRARLPELAQPLRAPAPAIAYFEALVQAQPLDGWANLALSLLAVAYRHLDEHDTSAYEHARTAAEAFPGCSLAHRLAAYHGPLLNARLDAVRSAVRAQPADTMARYVYFAQFAEREDFRSVLPELEALAAGGPLAPRLAFIEGRFLERQDLPVAARDAYTRAAAAYPRWEEPRRRLLALADRLDLTAEERLRLWREVIGVSATDEEAAGAYVAELLEAGRTDEARDFVALHWELKPWSVKPAHRLADAHLAAGELQVAAALLHSCSDRAPWRADTLRRLGQAEHAAGRTEQARAAWQEALALSGGDALVAACLERISPRAGRFYDPYWIEPEEIELPEEAPEETDRLLLLDQQVTRVYSDGTTVEMVREITQLLTESAVEGFRTRQVGYSPERETVRVLRARTTRRDGTVFDAREPESRSTLDAASRIYGDHRALNVTLQGLEPGCIVDFAYEVAHTGENLYADYFGQIFFVGTFAPILRTDYVVIMPGERPLHHLVSGGLEDTLRRRPLEEGRATEYRWRYAEREMVRYEPDMPPYSEVMPHIRVSTFARWDEMAAWYWSLSRDQFRFEPPVRDALRAVLANFIRTRKDPDFDPQAPFEAVAGYPLSAAEKVAAVNAFVNTDVRYLGLEFGIHGYKPHSPEQVCSAAYGDCKDKATLAVTLLEALGVPAALALVRTADRGEIDYSLASLHLFNHAIYYLPDVDGRPLWIDGTASYHGPTELPWEDQGINALVIFQDGTHRFIRTPTTTAADHGATYENRIVLDANGNALLTRRSTYKGLYNPTVRALYHNAQKRDENLERLWGGQFPGAKVLRAETGDLRQFETDEWLEYDLRLARLGETFDQGLRVPITFFPIRASDDYARLDRREWTLVRGSPSYPWYRDAASELVLPEGFRVVEAPDPVDLHTPFGSLVFRVEQTEPTLRWTHKVVMAATRVEAADYQDFRAFCAAIDRLDIRRFVLEGASAAR